MSRQSYLFAGCLLLAGAADPDILIEDFEGKDYGKWKVEGTAFGPGPARGTLPGQMPVSGFLGKGLVNSFYKGDDSTGTLTSPPFKVEQKYINFLIGGGPGETCINLLRGKAGRAATGPNTKPGGCQSRLEGRLDEAFTGVRSGVPAGARREGGGCSDSSTGRDIWWLLQFGHDLAIVGDAAPDPGNHRTHNKQD